jgi:hypothetical protein
MALGFLSHGSVKSAIVLKTFRARVCHYTEIRKPFLPLVSIFAGSVWIWKNKEYI